MNAKHTPGPWVASHNSWETSTVYADGRVVAECLIDADVSEENQHELEPIKEANARLIAAAPELLEALQEVIAISDRKHDAWDKAKAAIARATGDQHGRTP